MEARAQQSVTAGAPHFQSPDAALEALLAELAAVPPEVVDLSAAAGRILAVPLIADRDSPPCDVSAMDGYAVRLADLRQGAIPVHGEVSIGRPIATLPAGCAMRIFTGGPVPLGAEAVIRREDTEESPKEIRLRIAPQSISMGQDIRRRGENLPAGQIVVPRGALVTPALAAALAAFGAARPSVFRRVRVSVLTTGNELLSAADRAEPWQIRDSNGPALAALLTHPRWIELTDCRCLPDDRRSITAALEWMLGSSDAVLVTGGVSMGDHDYVPDAVQDVGGRIIFHHLPIRPGKPVLAAVASGKPILGLPGNPVSVLVTARRLAMAALARLGGLPRAAPADALVRIANFDSRPLKLHWFRLVRLCAPGVVELLPNQGSGDLVTAARADGFVEVPPGASGSGPFAFYKWVFA